MADTIEKVFCPGCGAEMKKVFLKNENFNIDVCTTCGGVFFDNREDKKITNVTNIDEIVKDLKVREFVKVDENKVRICASCGAKMVKNYASHLKNVEIDECYNCGGKFYDCSEISKANSEFEDKKQKEDSFKRFYQTEFFEFIKSQQEEE